MKAGALALSIALLLVFALASAESGPLLVYKTKADYYENVAIHASDDKTVVVDAPNTYLTNELMTIDREWIYPIKLHDDYLLAMRSERLLQNIANDVFLDATRKEYSDYQGLGSKLQYADGPLSEFADSVLDLDPHTELYNCGYSFEYKDSDYHKLNEIIDRKALAEECEDLTIERKLLEGISYTIENYYYVPGDNGPVRYPWYVQPQTPTLSVSGSVFCHEEDIDLVCLLKEETAKGEVPSALRTWGGHEISFNGEFFYLLYVGGHASGGVYKAKEGGGWEQCGQIPYTLNLYEEQEVDFMEECGIKFNLTGKSSALPYFNDIYIKAEWFEEMMREIVEERIREEEARFKRKCVSEEGFEACIVKVGEDDTGPPDDSVGVSYSAAEGKAEFSYEFIENCAIEADETTIEVEQEIRESFPVQGTIKVKIVMPEGLLARCFGQYRLGGMLSGLAAGGYTLEIHTVDSTGEDTLQGSAEFTVPAGGQAAWEKCVSSEDWDACMELVSEDVAGGVGWTTIETTYNTGEEKLDFSYSFDVPCSFASDSTELSIEKNLEEREVTIRLAQESASPDEGYCGFDIAGSVLGLGAGDYYLQIVAVGQDGSESQAGHADFTVPVSESHEWEFQSKSTFGGITLDAVLSQLEGTPAEEEMSALPTITRQEFSGQGLEFGLQYSETCYAFPEGEGPGDYFQVLISQPEDGRFVVTLRYGAESPVNCGPAVHSINGVISGAEERDYIVEIHKQTAYERELIEEIPIVAPGTVSPGAGETFTLRFFFAEYKKKGEERSAFERVRDKIVSRWECREDLSELPIEEQREIVYGEHFADYFELRDASNDEAMDCSVTRDFMNRPVKVRVREPEEGETEEDVTVTVTGLLVIECRDVKKGHSYKQVFKYPVDCGDPDSEIRSVEVGVYVDEDEMLR